MFSSSSANEEAPHDPAKTTVTYRHLLSPQTLSVYNPLRVVALIDSDAFYAACEQVRLGLDPEVPLAVQQWQGLIAINYPARKYGITRMETITEAKKKCPQLVAVHVATYKEGEKEAGYWPDANPKTHKVSLDHYRRESKKVLSVFQDVLPTAEIERASIDEAFFDLSIPIREAILLRYPYLSSVPQDAPNGLDSPLPPPPPISWAGLGNILPISPPAPPIQEPQEGSTPFAAQDGQTKTDAQKESGIVEEDDGHEDTWGDVALAIGAELVNSVRMEVRKRLGYTTSAGVARNKTMAKLCASRKKPFGQTILRDAAIPTFLRDLPFQKIRFLGGKLGDAIAKEYDAKTIGDLLTVSKAELQNQFGEESLWIYNILRGNDYSEVKERTAVKSMMAAKNIRPSAKTFEDCIHWLNVLSSELAIRLNEERDITPSAWPKTLVIHIRQGYETARSRQCPFPFSNSFSDETISKLAEKLLKELISSSPILTKEISNISLGFGGIGALEQGQKSIEGFFGNGGPSKPTTSDRDERPAAKRRKLGNPPLAFSAPGSTEEVPDTGNTYECPRCKKILTATAVEAEARDAQLAALRREHNDFHFAQDLEHEHHKLPERDQSGGETARPAGPRKKVKQKKKKPDGIAAYFSKV